MKRYTHADGIHLIDENGNDYKLLVFVNQKKCYRDVESNISLLDERHPFEDIEVIDEQKCNPEAKGVKQVTNSAEIVDTSSLKMRTSVKNTVLR